MFTFSSLLPLLHPAGRSLMLLAALSLSVGLGAQDLRQIMPEPVPPQVEASVAPEAVDYPSLKRAVGGAGPDEEVLLTALKGILFLRDESQLDNLRLEPGQVSNLAVRPELNVEAITGLVELFVGESVSNESIQRLRLAISLSLASMGRPFSVVYTPPQDITDGVVQLVVRQSEVAAVRVEGARHFSDEIYQSLIDQPLGAAVDAAALKTGVDRINRNSFRQAMVRAEKGTEPGTTDIVLQVRDRFPWRVFTGYSNTGTLTTTEDRVNAGINWGNAFGRGHLATLQWTSDLEAKYSRSISANYVADLPRNHALTVFGAYSKIVSVPNGGLSTEGLSWQVGMNYDLPLHSVVGDYTHSLQFGTDFKASDNNIEFALPPFIIPISDNLTHIAQVRAEYQGTLADDFGVTSARLKLTASPGGITAENDDAAFGATRSGAQASYAYATLILTRQTPLDVILPRSSWTVRGQFQLASGNLLGSEQFSGGGSGSVRGYEQGEVVGDNGLLLSQELNLPGFAVLPRLLGDGVRDAFSPYLFHDYARLWNVDKLSGERPFNLHSVGVGARYQLTSHGSVQAAYGWQLRDSGSSDTGKNSRVHLSANLSF